MARNDLMTTIEASYELGVGEAMIRYLVKKGALPTGMEIKRGMRVTRLFKRADVERLKRDREKGKFVAA